MNIRPILDLKDCLCEIEEDVLNNGETVFLIKNDNACMVLLSLERYEALTNDVESSLEEADIIAELSEIRYCNEEVFTRVRKHLRHQKGV